MDSSCISRPRRFVARALAIASLLFWFWAATPAMLVASPVTAPADGPREISGFGWAMNALGPFYGIVFASLAVTSVALLVLNLLSLHRETVLPEGLIERFEQLALDRRYQEAYEAACDDGTPLGRVLQSAMGRLPFGRVPATEAMQEATGEETMKLEQRLSYLALVGTVAPMVGLLGTVHGMIASFTVIATHNQTPKPWELAGGISTALFTTLVGLAIAIPSIAAYNILRNRAARLSLEMVQLGEDLLLRVFQSARSTDRKGTDR